jgi:hypothetical protein
MSKPANIGERVATVEELLRGVVRRLDQHDDATKALADKLDIVIANQQTGAHERAEIRKEIAEFRPEAETVRDFKKVIRVFGWLAGGIASLVVATWGAWLWFATHFKWRG